MPSPHSPEFRRRAIELARQVDKPLFRLAKDLGISRAIIALVRALADDNVPVARVCRVLHVSTSGYHDRLKRPESPRELRNRQLTQLIRQIHADSRGRYGSPRIHAHLRLRLGEEADHKRVERLQREAGPQVIHRRKPAGQNSGVQHRAEAETPDPARPAHAAAGPSSLEKKA